MVNKSGHKGVLQELVTNMADDIANATDGLIFNDQTVVNNEEFTIEYDFDWDYYDNTKTMQRRKVKLRENIHN
jgi:hypothetical protein